MIMKELVSTYNTFSERLEDISSFISNIMTNNDTWASLSSLSLNDKQRQVVDYIQSSNGKTIQYNAVIISLYGCFENYIDSVFSNYLDIIFSCITDYDNLPKGIKDKYAIKLGEYLTSPQRFSGIEVTRPQLIENYLNLLNSNNYNSINKAFLLMHSGNLKVEQVFSFMREMGIENVREKIFKNVKMKDFFVSVLGFEDIDYNCKLGRNSTELYTYLDKLVEQRNNVAHSWVEENRISMHDIKTYVIPFIKLFSEVMLRTLLCEATEFIKANHQDKLTLNVKPMAVYNNRIVCFHLNKKSLTVGDYIIYTSPKGNMCGKILCIEIDNVKVDCIKDTECDIGIEIDTRISPSSIVLHSVSMV